VGLLEMGGCVWFWASAFAFAFAFAVVSLEGCKIFDLIDDISRCVFLGESVGKVFHSV
jgi:hypothetical protein